MLSTSTVCSLPMSFTHGMALHPRPSLGLSAWIASIITAFCTSYAPRRRDLALDLGLCTAVRSMYLVSPPPHGTLRAHTHHAAREWYLDGLARIFVRLCARYKRYKRYEHALALLHPKLMLLTHALPHPRPHITLAPCPLPLPLLVSLSSCPSSSSSSSSSSSPSPSLFSPPNTDTRTHACTHFC